MELKIYKASNEIFQEAVRTIPIIPLSGHLEFLAEGLDKGDIDYAIRCKKAKIVGNSSVDLRYDYHSGLFYFSNIAFSGEDNRTFIRGGRIGRINIRMESLDSSAFEKFRREYFDSLVINGYQLNNGHLWLSYRTIGSHEGKGEMPLSTLSFGKDKGIELMLKHPDDENEAIKVWFDRLRKF